MKEFDIELAKQGKPVCTRDGRSVRILCFDSKHDSQRPIVALVTDVDNGRELLYEYTVDGSDDFAHRRCSGTSDLMMASEKKEGWMAIYRNVNSSTKDITPASNIYENRETLENLINKDKVRAIIKVEWEE